MHIRTGLGCLLSAACCVGLAACAATAPKGPDVTVTAPSIGKPAAPTSVQAALSRMAFTPYAALGGSTNDGLAPGESSYALGQACLNVAGYPDLDDYLPAGAGFVGAIGLAFSQPYGAWGYLGAADAQEYGFLVPKGTLLSQLGISRNGLNLASLSQAEQTAFGKCATITVDFSTTEASGPLAGIATMGTDISNDLAQNAAIKTATKAWAACMARNGYTDANPTNAANNEIATAVGNGNSTVGNSNSSRAVNVGPSVSAAANQAQITMAVTDANCSQSTDLAGIYFAIQASYEQQIVSANQTALASAVQKYRAAYQKEVSEMPHLLATAQAFGKGKGKGLKLVAP